MSIPYKKVKLFYKPIILLGGHTDDRHFMINNLMTMLNDLDQIVDGQDYEEDESKILFKKKYGDIIKVLVEEVPFLIFIDFQEH